MTTLRIVLFQSILALEWQFLVATRQCLSTSSKYGFILVGSVFKSFPTQGLHVCSIACQRTPVCQSLNYNLVENFCELSTEMKKSRPENYQRREMFVYAEKLFDRERKGFLATVPGESCEDIKGNGGSDISATYWIRPEGSPASFLGYCDMSAVGRWKKITQSWIDSTLKGGVRLTYGEEADGLIISGHVTSVGCGRAPASGALIFIKGYWKKIKYTQEFRGRSSCWSIFGSERWGHTSVTNTPTGLYPFSAEAGDAITDEYHMGENSHEFDGKVARCDNLVTNFWRNQHSLRHATVVLRRQPMAEKAGIFTGTSCGTPTYKIKNIHVYF